LCEAGPELRVKSCEETHVELKVAQQWDLFLVHWDFPVLVANMKFRGSRGKAETKEKFAPGDVMLSFRLREVW
jgi:hypothetical protein